MSESNSVLEVFNAQEKPLLEKWNIPNFLKSSFDDTGKCYVFNLENSTSIKWLNNNNEESSYHNYVIYQLFVPENKELSFEISICGFENTKHNILFKTTLIKPIFDGCNAEIPLENLKRSRWLNLCIDIPSFMKLWQTTDFKYLHRLVMFSNCKLRRIFLLKSDEIHGETSQIAIPKPFQFNKVLNSAFQLINLDSIQNYGFTTNGILKPHPPLTTPNQKYRSNRKTRPSSNTKCEEDTDEVNNGISDLSINNSSISNDNNEDDDINLFTYFSEPSAVQRKSPSSTAIKNRQNRINNFDKADFSSDSETQDFPSTDYIKLKKKFRERKAISQRLKKNTLKLSSYNDSTILQQKAINQQYSVVESFEADILEADILAAMQKEDEEVCLPGDGIEKYRNHTFGKDPDDDSISEANFTTANNLEINPYHDEMKAQSGRWNKDFFGHSQITHDIKSKKDKDFGHNKYNDNDFDDEEMLDLIFDPVLNCYYDPCSKIYYELK